MSKNRDDGKGDSGIELDMGMEGTDGDVKAELDANKLDNMFKFPQGGDNVKLLMSPGKILELCMRANIPSRRYTVALASYYRKCVEHKYWKGAEQVLMMIASMCSIGGDRAELVSRTIIGNYQQSASKGHGVMERIKKLYGGDD